MRTFVWPAEDGWPYPDGDGDQVDVGGEVDDDLLTICSDRHVFDSLDHLERLVIVESFGLEGHDVLTIHELHDLLGISDADLEHAMDTGLEKLRTQLRV